MSSSDDPVDRFLSSALIPIRNTDRVKYPLTPSRVKTYYLDLAASAFLRARKLLRDRGWSMARMAATFRNPSRVMRMSYYLLEGSRMLGHGSGHQRDLLDFLIALVGELKASDPYGHDQQNLQWPNEAALHHIGAERLPSIDPDSSRRFHRLAALLRTYMDAVYLVPHDVGMEMYGPYEDAERRYFVRDFFNLRAPELWPATARVSCSEVWMVAGYTPELQVTFDVFNNPYVEGESYLTACRTAAVRIDGETPSPERIESVTGELLAVVKEVVGEMRALSEADRAGRYIRCFWRRMAGFLDAADLPTEPPEEVFVRLRERPTLPASGAPPTLADLTRNLGV